jgi:hypothetical protein
VGRAVRQVVVIVDQEAEQDGVGDVSRVERRGAEDRSLATA